MTSIRDANDDLGSRSLAAQTFVAVVDTRSLTAAVCVAERNFPIEAAERPKLPH
jgi:hypothetical protein